MAVFNAMRIRPEPAKALTAHQECEILRAALARNPRSAPIRLRMAKLLNQLDAFDETIALLTGAEAGALDHQMLLVLVAAYLARATAADWQQACDAARHALALAENDSERSMALADAAKASLRIGEPEAARGLLESALQLDPHNKNAFRRLFTHLLDAGDAAEVIGLTDRLASQGVGHARLLAARAMALARLGQIGAARDTLNLSDFLYTRPISVPPGWDSLERFNAALATELLAHPAMRYDRYGTASVGTWRIDSPAAGAAPAARALLACIAETVEQRFAGLSDFRHPWLALRPSRGSLRSWCVITAGDGFEQWHMHPFGWLSGGYYVAVPPSVETGSDARGCLAFGLPSGLIGEDAAHALGEVLVRPRPGLLTMFPSHCYHRTFAHNDPTRRICIAFDILPI